MTTRAAHPKLWLPVPCGHLVLTAAQPRSVVTCPECGWRGKISQRVFNAGTQARPSQQRNSKPAPDPVPEETPPPEPPAPEPPAPAPDETPPAGDITLPAGSGIRLADVDEATAPLKPPLRALIRLMLSAETARYHLRGTRTSGYLSGLAAGPTQTGKTLTGLAVARALGLDLVEVKRLTSAESEKSLWGRREQQAKDTWTIRPAPVLATPFVIVDELDKAAPAVRKATLRLMQGETLVPGEPGQMIEIACTALVTANGSAAIVPPEYRRRSVVVDTTGAPVVDPATAAAVLDTIPRLPYEQLPPPASTLPPGLLREMHDTLRRRLSEQGFQLTDVRALELAALGRAALTGDTLEDAVADTISDYLTCAATTGDIAAPPAVAVDEDEDDEDQEVDEEDQPPARLTYRQRIGLYGMRTMLRSQLAAAVRDLRAVDGRPGVPRGYFHQARGILDQAAQVHQDLDDAADVTTPAGRDRFLEIAACASELTERADDLAAEIRPHAAEITSTTADAISGYLMNAARTSPVPVITTAPERPALTTSGHAQPGMRLDMFTRAGQQLAEHATPAAADTSIAERVHTEQQRRDAAGLPPLTPAEIAAMYTREPAPVIPLLLRRRRNAG